MDNGGIAPYVHIRSYPVCILYRVSGLVTLEVIMWGAALFFITILAVTPYGRAAADEYVRQTLSQFAAQLPCSEVALALMALSALGCLLMMRGGRAVQRRAEYWVWREIRGHCGDEPSPNRVDGLGE
jgi:hypothetical protein